MTADQLLTVLTAAGMGSQLLVYELFTGRMMLDHTVFSSGVHVHGIHAVQLPEAWLLAVHGERFVTVSLCSQAKSQSKHSAGQTAIPNGALRSFHHAERFHCRFLN